MHCFLLECIWIYFNEFIYLVNKNLLRIYSVVYPEHIIKADKMWGCLWLLRICLPVQGVGIQSLVGGLRSHTLWSSKACVHNKDPV